MGLAASQARFLGLTARKSNVEYEGQQVNQQRTALAEEVNSLYNSLASLSMPIAPDATAYYKSNYSFSTVEGNNIIKSYFKNANGKYHVNASLTHDKPVAAGKSVSSSTISKNDENAYVYTPAGGDSYALTLVDDENRSVMADLINSTYGKGTIADGVNLYSFKDNDGETHYFSQAQLDKALNKEISGLPYYTSSSKTVTDNVVYDNAVFRYDANNRISSITFELNGETATVDVDTTRDYDSDGYDAALRDYTMSRDEYNRKVQELNAKTESLQQEDKILEMRLDQINTEQNELKTELDAVKSLLKDNIEKTFNTFS